MGVVRQIVRQEGDKAFLPLPTVTNLWRSLSSVGSLFAVPSGGRTMVAVAFDTFKFVNRLEEAGLSRSQAVAISDAQQQALTEALDSTLATKSDLGIIRDELRETKAELKSDVGAVRDELRATKAELKDDITRLEGSIVRLEASTKADIAHLEASTKADIARLETSTKTAIGAVRDELRETKAELKSDVARLESNIEKMELRLIIKLSAIMTVIMSAGIGALVTLLKLLH